jgi:hypothetical protein
MLPAMNTWSPTSASLRPPGLGAASAAGWPLAPLTPAAPDLARAADAAGRAAAWFNAPVVEGSLVLRAPVQPGSGDADTLRQRFLASLQGPETA